MKESSGMNIETSGKLLILRKQCIICIMLSVGVIFGIRWLEFPSSTIKNITSGKYKAVKIWGTID